MQYQENILLAFPSQVLESQFQRHSNSVFLRFKISGCARIPLDAVEVQVQAETKTSFVSLSGCYLFLTS
jgi:hypothetical protein